MSARAGTGARSAADRALRLAAGATFAAAVLVPIVYFPRLAAPFLVPKVAALEITAAIAFGAFALRALAEPGRPLWARPVAAGAWLLLGTTLVSWLTAARAPPGAPYAVDAVARWAALLGLACGAAVIARDPPRRARLLQLVAAVAGVVSAVGLWQHLDLVPLAIPVISAPGSTFGNRNLAGEAVALSVPFGLAALIEARGQRGRQISLGVALAVSLIYLGATRARGAWLGGAAGAVVFLLLVRPRVSRTAAAVVLGTAVLAAAAGLVPGRWNPRYFTDAKRFASGIDLAEASFDARSTALRTRMGLWRRSIAIVREHPVFGVGPGNWPVVFPRFAEPGAAEEGVLRATLTPRQAHNDVIERLSETGAAGLAAFLAFLAAVVWAARLRLRARDEGERASCAAACGTLVALVASGLTGFPLEMPGTIMLAALALGLVAAGARPNRDETPALGSRAPLGRVGLVLAAAAMLVALVRAERAVRTSYWLARAEHELWRDLGPLASAEAVRELEMAVKAMPENARAWFRLAQAQLRLGRGEDAERAARRALELEPWSPHAWPFLAAAQLRAGDPHAAHASAARALALLHDSPRALWVEEKAARQEGDLSAATHAHQRLSALAALPSVDRETASLATQLLREP